MEATALLKLTDGTEEESLTRMRTGDLDAVIVVPAGLGAEIAHATSGSAATTPLALVVYTDPSQTTKSQTIQQIVSQVVAATNLVASGTPPVLVMQATPVQTQDLTAAAYFVPSILAMALMQLGIFSAIPLVEQRQKLILKRLSATPLRRWQLVASNIVMRLLIAMLQALIIVGIGSVLFDVKIVGSLLLAFGFVDPGCADVHRHRLRHRLVRADGGGGQRADQRGPVPDDVPLGHLLSHRLHARVPAADRGTHPADLPR